MDHIRISENGAIMLGDRISVDGFSKDADIRVQTHVHQDHLLGFETSKGLQDVLMSGPTKDLLIAEMNADLNFRRNLINLELSQQYSMDDVSLRLVDNNHMLGSVQVEVVLPNGIRCGYSGDFNWPLDDVISVDELVIDSTYGSPNSVRAYTQEDAENALMELIVDGIRKKPIYIKAFKGTLERAINCLSGEIKVPIIATKKQMGLIKVYQSYGYAMDEVFEEGSKAARLANNGMHIKLGGHYERSSPDYISITLSAYSSGMIRPFTRFSDNAFSVAMTSHADYEGTMQYILATGAQKVLTDNSRGGKAIELAMAIRSELGIDAEHSKLSHSFDWG